MSEIRFYTPCVEMSVDKWFKMAAATLLRAKKKNAQTMLVCKETKAGIDLQKNPQEVHYKSNLVGKLL